MRRIATRLAVLTLCALAYAGSAGAQETSGRFVEVRSYSVPEAKQGVAVDSGYFYAIDNAAIAKQAYTFPRELTARFAPNSSSGGNWGPDGLLYVTGHDEREVYVLRLLSTGSVLEWVATIPAPIEGQAWGFDPAASRTLWGVRRSTREVVVARLTE